MEPESWRRVEAAFFEAIALPPDQRDSYVRTVFADDAVLLREVQAVLHAHEQAGDTSAPHHVLPAFDQHENTASRVGSRLGPYQLDSLIERGGMGEVYRASRADDEYKQQVAIKVMRAGRSTPESARRFRIERQILATLQHPNIATLLDGGVTPQGEPYLVMQYVDGTPITQYANETGLSIEARLRLLIVVAHAIQYAHANLVVHRDLKPSNILIAKDGQAHVLDFGIAKLLHDDLGEPSTESLLYLTPEHAAPEQFLGDPVTTATDVYALGVLLYELLAGVRPFQHLTPVELGRAVCETEPQPPSKVAAESTARQVRGDLDQIALKALQKDPARRYASAGQFADDLARFLAGQPVVARPDVLGYRIQKFVRRNKVVVAASGLVAATLLGAMVLTARESSRRAAALRVANAERATATRIADFMIDVFNANDPTEARGRTVTARELLDRAATNLNGQLRDEPATRADVGLAIARAYHSLGLASQAQPLFDEALAYHRGHQPPDESKLATALEWQARNAVMRGDPKEGVSRMQEALALREQAPVADSVAIGRTLTMLAGYLTTLDYLDSSLVAERTAQRALATLRSVDPPPHREIAQALRALGHARADRAPAEALAPLREAVDEARKVVSESDPFLFNLQEGLAIMYQVNGRSDSAIAIGRRLLEARRRVFGTSHPDYAFSLFNLARTLTRAKQFAEGLPLFQQAIEVRQNALGPNHYLTGYAWHSYAVATAQSGDLATSAQRFENAVAIFRVALGPTDGMLQDALEGLAIVHTLQGRNGAALSALESAIAAGYDRPQRLSQAPFDRLSGEPRFQSLVSRMTKAR
jgi:serine/threonine-protein kinase